MCVPQHMIVLMHNLHSGQEAILWIECGETEWFPFVKVSDRGFQHIQQNDELDSNQRSKSSNGFKGLLLKLKEVCAKAGLQFNIKKLKITNTGELNKLRT